MRAGLLLQAVTVKAGAQLRAPGREAARGPAAVPDFIWVWCFSEFSSWCAAWSAWRHFSRRRHDRRQAPPRRSCSKSILNRNCGPTFIIFFMSWRARAMERPTVFALPCARLHWTRRVSALSRPAIARDGTRRSRHIKPMPRLGYQLREIGGRQLRHCRSGCRGGHS